MDGRNIVSAHLYAPKTEIKSRLCIEFILAIGFCGVTVAEVDGSFPRAAVKEVGNLKIPSKH